MRSMVNLVRQQQEIAAAREIRLARAEGRPPRPMPGIAEVLEEQERNPPKPKRKYKRRKFAKAATALANGKEDKKLSCSLSLSAKLWADLRAESRKRRGSTVSWLVEEFCRAGLGQPVVRAEEGPASEESE